MPGMSQCVLCLYGTLYTHDKSFRDTVSSIGIARGKKMLPRTIDGMKHVCFFRHALALDERRVKFLPEYAYGGSATCDIFPSDEVERSQGVNKLTVKHPQTLEVWFAGTHSDM